MPIFDQGYQHWNGKLSGHAFRWTVITRQGVLTVSKLKAVRAIMILAWFPALVLVLFLSLWGLIEQKSALLTPFLNLLNALPEEIRNGPTAYRRTIWTLAYYNFFSFEIVFSLLIVAIVGPSLISQDLRFNAIPLYFAKPLRRIDYFIGKLGVIATFIGAVTVVPAVLAYVLGAGFSFDPKVILDTWPILLGSVAFGGVVALSGGMLMLAISSMSKNSRYVAAVWMGIWIVTGIAGEILTNEIRRPWCPLVSYQQNLNIVRNHLIGTAEARRKVFDLIESGERKLREQMAAQSPLGQLGLLRNRRGRPIPPPPPPRGSYPELGDQDPTLPQNRRLPFVPDADKTPATWPMLVLAGLFGLSTWILTTRVKSLDRLR